MYVEERPFRGSAATLFRPIAHEEGGFLLESPRPDPVTARWSILGFRPLIWFRADRTRGWWSAGSQEPPPWLSAMTGIHPRDLMTAAMKQLPVPAGADALPFAGGWVGYFGYDAAHWFERLPAQAADDLALPVAMLGLYDSFACIDHSSGRLFLASAGLDQDLSGTDSALARARVSALGKALEAPSTAGAFAGMTPVVIPPPAGFVAAVDRALEYIAAGDVFQVNLAQRLSCGLEGDAFALYERLLEVNPSPFASFIRAPGLTLVGSSPERLVRVGPDESTGRLIETRPIAGTHPRLPDPLLDQDMRDRLLMDPKERSEHVMMVDLGRNDLGRVCRYGSVKVNEFFALETYSHVHHLVSNVQGRLRPGVGPMEVLAAVFPGGTITGAPKIRSMEIIDELEPVRRNAYTGSAGYIGLDGRLDLNIAIRTMQIVDQMAYLYAGAGIVADSIPVREYRETLHKAEALLQALGVTAGAGVTARL